MKRPVGVMLISILTIIGGIFYLIAGVMFVGIASVTSQFNVSATSITLDGIFGNNSISAFLTEFLGLFGGSLIALGIASFIVARGLLKGKGWAWIITGIIMIISIILGVTFIAIFVIEGEIFSMSVSIASLIMDGGIIWYLFRSNVKLYFGRIKAHPS
jgi:hypothetical protein